MQNSWTTLVLGAAANMAAVLLAAPLCEGVLRKVTAGLQSRRGPPLWQPYMDLLKFWARRTSNRANPRRCSGSSPGSRWRRR